MLLQQQNTASANLTWIVTPQTRCTTLALTVCDSTPIMHHAAICHNKSHRSIPSRNTHQDPCLSNF